MKNRQYFNKNAEIRDILASLEDKKVSHDLNFENGTFPQCTVENMNQNQPRVRLRDTLNISTIIA